MAAPDKIHESSLSKSKQPTALVAGGAGFVGSHLVKTLIAQNFHVICVDNLSTGKKENLRDLLTSPNFTFIQEDVNNSSFSLPNHVKIDYCFHLAGSEDYQRGGEFSLDTLLVNSLGTKQLLEIAKQNQAKFVLVSSADLYSGAISSSSLRYYFGKSPEDEAVLSLQEAKRFAEALTFEYYKKFELPVTIIRLKDVYGPHMNFERGDELAELLSAAIEKKPLKIYGDGLKTINPTYISDVVFGMVKAAFGEFNGEIFVLVNPEKITIENFAQTLKLVAGPLEIEHKKEGESAELPFTHLEVANTKEKLSWSPKVSLAEGISSVIQTERLGKPEVAPVSNTMEELKPLEIEVAKPPVVEPIKEVTKDRSKVGIWLRLGIFLASLGLLIATVIYPVAASGINSLMGRGALKSASESLKNESTEKSINDSLKAQRSFESAAKNLQNISWLFKIIGLNNRSVNFDHLLQASTTLSEAVRFSARANQLLIDTANKQNLTTEEASNAFNEILNNLYSSQDKLEQTQLQLTTVDWSKIPTLIAPEKDSVTKDMQDLQTQVKQLIEEVESRL